VNEFPLPEPFEARDVVCDSRRLILSGELDIASASELEAILLQVSQDGSTAITLDLSRLTFMDSTGLRAVLFAKELADRHGRAFSLVPGPPEIQRLFEITALLDVLPFEAGNAEGTSLSEPRTAAELGS
jgi:anti-sigma B factor antagonist